MLWNSGAGGECVNPPNLPKGRSLKTSFMTSEQVLDIILDEINSKFDISNHHGVDLRKALITPILQEYKSAIDKSQTFKLWTVLEETKNKNGYKIFYNDEENYFGLGIKSEKDELLYLGNYGTFLETLEGM